MEEQAIQLGLAGEGVPAFAEVEDRLEVVFSLFFSTTYTTYTTYTPVASKDGIVRLFGLSALGQVGVDLRGHGRIAAFAVFGFACIEPDQSSSEVDLANPQS